MRLRDYESLLDDLFCVIVTSYIFESYRWFSHQHTLIQLSFEAIAVLRVKVVVYVQPQIDSYATLVLLILL